jgi:hypothetical protein
VDGTAAFEFGGSERRERRHEQLHHRVRRPCLELARSAATDQLPEGHALTVRNRSENTIRRVPGLNPSRAPRCPRRPVRETLTGAGGGAVLSTVPSRRESNQPFRMALDRIVCSLFPLAAVADVPRYGERPCRCCASTCARYEISHGGS